MTTSAKPANRRAKIFVRGLLGLGILGALWWGAAALRSHDQQQVLDTFGEDYAKELQAEYNRQPYSLEREITRNESIADDGVGDWLSAIYAYEGSVRRSQYNRMVRILETIRSKPDPEAFLALNIQNQADAITEHLRRHGEATDADLIAQLNAMQTELSLWLRARYHFERGSTLLPISASIFDTHSRHSEGLTR